MQYKGRTSCQCDYMGPLRARYDNRFREGQECQMSKSKCQMVDALRAVIAMLQVCGNPKASAKIACDAPDIVARVSNGGVLSCR